MEAFVGVPLSSARTFVTGGSVPARKIANGKEDTSHGRSVVVPTAQFKLPDFKLPDLPFGKGKKAPAKPQVAAPLIRTPSADGPSTKTKYTKPSSTKSPVRVALTLKEREAAAAQFIASQPKTLPKFYNPTTASAQFQVKNSGQDYSTPGFDSRIGKATNERTNDNGAFRNMDLYTDPLVWARPGWDSTEARDGIAVAIKNVFGNANLFESEMAELDYSISCVTKTADMKEFVRALGLSYAYKKRFFTPCSNQRFVELNFKHFLGRAPRSQAEIAEHMNRLETEGYNAEINSYVDSAEYASLFGKSRVPAVNFRGGHLYNNDMNKLAVLTSGYSSSDRLVTKASITNGDKAGYTGYGVYKGLPTAWRSENAAREEAGPLMSFPDDKFWNAKLASVQADELAWKAKWGAVPYYYKNSLPYEQSVAPKLTNTPAEVDEGMADLKYGSLMGKFFVGTRKSFDMAPEIVLKAPTNGIGGMVSVSMKTIEPAVPAELAQSE